MIKTILFKNSIAEELFNEGKIEGICKTIISIVNNYNIPLDSALKNTDIPEKQFFQYCNKNNIEITQ